MCGKWISEEESCWWYRRDTLRLSSGERIQVLSRRWAAMLITRPEIFVLVFLVLASYYCWGCCFILTERKRYLRWKYAHIAMEGALGRISEDISLDAHSTEGYPYKTNGSFRKKHCATKKKNHPVESHLLLFIYTEQQKCPWVFLIVSYSALHLTAPNIHVEGTKFKKTLKITRRAGNLIAFSVVSNLQVFRKITI